MAGPKDKKNGLDSLRDAVWDKYRDTYKGGYSKDDAAKDTDASRSEVDRAWSDASKDGNN